MAYDGSFAYLGNQSLNYHRIDPDLLEERLQNRFSAR